MPVYRKVPMSVHIVELTADLASQLAVSGYDALSGNGTCDLRDLEYSCFQRERCASRSLPLHLHDLLSSDHPIVALSSDKTFLGCAAVDFHAKRQQYRFSQHAIPDNAIMCWTLCVANAYRGCGVGHALMQHIRKFQRPLYLFIKKPNADDAHEALAKSEQRLKETYVGHMSFALCDECPEYHLLVDTSEH